MWNLLFRMSDGFGRWIELLDWGADFRRFRVNEYSNAAEEISFGDSFGE